VRTGLINLPGLTSIRYQPEQDIFVITSRQAKLKVADMFAAIWMAGRKQGQEFVPEIVG
jgi:hypothetical protein